VLADFKEAMDESANFKTHPFNSNFYSMHSLNTFLTRILHLLLKTDITNAPFRPNLLPSRARKQVWVLKDNKMLIEYTTLLAKTTAQGSPRTHMTHMPYFQSKRSVIKAGRVNGQKRGQAKVDLDSVELWFFYCILFKMEMADSKCYDGSTGSSSYLAACPDAVSFSLF
jgi:hypothetical protein